MVCFQTKNPNFGKFWRVLQWKILVYFMSIWTFLGPLEISYGHLVYFVVIMYIFPRFGILDQEKSGNPAQGDQIGQIFAYWVIVYFGHFSENYKSIPNSLGYFFPV
jgi:hypothetical protein